VNKSSINLQDVFLNQVRKDRLAVTVYMTNGFQLKGYVRGFDNFTVVLDSDGKQQLIYKHAISTVSPIKPVNLIFADNTQSHASHMSAGRPVGGAMGAGGTGGHAGPAPYGQSPQGAGLPNSGGYPSNR